MGQPATILFLGVSSSSSSRGELDREAREIDQRLRSSEHREVFRVAQAWAVRASDLQELLLRYSPTIVHFSGHGDQGGALVMEDERGGAVPVSAANLADLFRILRGPARCVVLSASYSEAHAKAISEHVDCVIGMTKPLPDISHSIRRGLLSGPRLRPGRLDGLRARLQSDRPDRPPEPGRAQATRATWSSAARAPDRPSPRDAPSAGAHRRPGLAERVDLKPERYIERLQRAQERMKLVEAALSSSVELLDQPARELWSRLGVMPADFDASAAAAVGCGALAEPARAAGIDLKAPARGPEPWAAHPRGITTEAVDDKLGELVRRSLLDWDDAAERYRMHDLARDYARSLMDPAERYAAEWHHADHYMRRACRACLLYEQGGPTSTRSLHGFERELGHISAAHAWALAHSGADRKAATVCFSLPLVAGDLLALRLPPRERLALLEGSLAVAQRFNARAEYGRMRCAVGNVYADIGEAHSAIECFRQAIAIARDLGDASGEGKAQTSLGAAYLSLGEPRRAMEA